MKSIWQVAAFVVAIISVCGMACANPAGTYYLSCIATNLCGGNGALEYTDLHAYETVFVAGYYAPGDQGGGTFFNTGLTAPMSCTPDGGQIITDSLNLCFQRINSHWGPKEFGAKGDGTTNDYNSLNAWLQTPQPHIGDVGVYGIRSELQCPANTTIQGPNNLDGNAVGGVNQPLFQIKALASMTDVIDAKSHCRLSGVAINANNQGSTNGVKIDGAHVTIDGFSMVENGYDNVTCNSSAGGLEIKDTVLTNAANDNVDAPNSCDNVRLIGDIFQNSGSDNVLFNTDELVIANGVIEESSGWGLNLSNARKVSVSAMHIQGNLAGGILIHNANTISVCGNHMEGNGGGAATLTTSAHVLFTGTDDNINLCGNVYEAQNQQAAFSPFYQFDAGSSAIVTNSHIHDTPVPQAVGAYTSTASTILSQLQVPQLTQNDISGLTLSNDSMTLTKVNIATGTAADSTNSTMIQMSSTCPDDINNLGLNGRDAGSLTTNTTYFYFLISDAAGGNPSCIASTNTAPSFQNTTSTYTTSIQGETYLNLPYLYNISTMPGVFTGQTFVSSVFNAGSPISIASTGSLAIQQAGSVSPLGGNVQVVFSGSGSTNSMGPDMQVSDDSPNMACGVAPQHLLGNGVVISAITGANTMNITGYSGAIITSDCITVTSGYTVTLGYNATSTCNPATMSCLSASATVYTGLYRMVGALYTYTSGMAIDVIPFHQHGDTFDLDSPAVGINSSVTTSLANYTVAGIPTGIPVAALGRCVGTSSVVGQDILMYPQTAAPATAPNAFPTAPGYAVRTTSVGSQANTAFPYRLDTNASAQVAAQANGASTLQCMTDGWVFHRGG